MSLPLTIDAVPVCGANASPILAAGLPLINTLSLPTATTPLELPQHSSFSVVMLPTVAAGFPLINTCYPDLLVSAV